jgi:hypothetical protein
MAHRKPEMRNLGNKRNRLTFLRPNGYHVPSSLTFQNSTFCAQSVLVFVCVLYGSQNKDKLRPIQH